MLVSGRVVVKEFRAQLTFMMCDYFVEMKVVFRVLRNIISLSGETSVARFHSRIQRDTFATYVAGN
jgi:hypothetical protein